MKRSFTKYSATGNDFLIFDNRDLSLSKKEINYWKSLCTRRTGVGADGVLFLEPSDELDFHMTYLNADGGEVGMCGNGARALIHFAHELMNKSHFKFSTMNAQYEGSVQGDDVTLLMTELRDVDLIRPDWFSDYPRAIYLNSGVPHVVIELNEELRNINLVNLGRQYSHDPLFEEGCNINFIYRNPQNIVFIRTYERGVEDETLACGTGVTAAAHALNHWQGKIDSYLFHAQGGELFTSAAKDNKTLYFGGKVAKIFRGELC